MKLTLVFFLVSTITLAIAQYDDPEDDDSDDATPGPPSPHPHDGDEPADYGHTKYGNNYNRPYGGGYGPDPYYGDYYYDDYDYGYDYGYRRITCEKLEDPENGSVKQRGIYRGSKAVYSCDEGYILTGDKVQVCKGNGQYSSEAPTCEPIDCGEPASPDNGDVSYDDTTLGNTATQSCNEGYIRDGVEERTCQADGTWSDDVAECTPVDCGEPPAPINGAVSFDETTLGNTATQSCNEGYIQDGVDERTCQANGTWSDDVAECTPVDCGEPPAPINGAVSFDETTLGNTATQSCNEGYIQDGVDERTCQADGSWSDDVAECTPVDCGEPPAPDNGDVSFDDTTLGNTATQSCNVGFILQGDEERTCQSDGSWSGDVAECEAVLCDELEDPENGMVDVPSRTVFSVATYTCNEGYVRDGPRIRGCQPSGEWSSLAPECRPVNCGQPEDADPNGSVLVDGTTLGSTATYSCNEGYDLVGEETATCQTDGTWSSGAPECRPVNCGQPEDADPNGSVSVDDTTLGSTATYSCNEGYDLVGEETATCQADGTWSSGAPQCTPVDCGQPEDADPNGSVSVDDTTLGSTATYSCSEGYDLVGEATATCQADGTWSSGAPQCAPVDCGQPEDADPNGSVSVDDTIKGSTATYSCNEGYNLVGEETATCQADRTWSSGAPDCEPVDCGSLSAPDNGGVVTDPDTTLGSTATYSCNEGFKLVGDDERKCETSGSWSGEQPVCEKIKCPKLKIPSYGRVFQSGRHPGDHAIYRCSYGYYLSGNHRRVCQISGSWTGTDAECKRRRPYYAYGGRRHGGGYRHDNGDYHDDDNDDYRA